MLHVCLSNRLETLAEQFVERVDAAGVSVFEAPEVIVPSAAVRRWLKLAVARRHGICANLRFGYLAQWLWEQIGRAVPGVTPQSPFEPQVLAWRIDALFGDAAWVDAQPRLRAWLAHADRAMRFELAQQVAGLVDRAVTYRPDWLAAWSRGERVALAHDAQDDQAWLAPLWRHLCAPAGQGEPHPAEAFRRALAAADPPPSLPRELHVFALPAIAPLHLDLLGAVAQRIDVHVYAPNPCREYWFELVGRRRLARLAVRAQADHHEEGNRLLASWGGPAQSHLSRLLACEGESALVHEHYAASPAAHLLAQCQNAILELRELAPGSLSHAHGDRSLELHVCHSLGREVEVLQDTLLALFAAPDAPAPGEVLVVAPDLDAVAPLVDAVFGTAPPDRFIPYAITGRARSSVNTAAHALLELLALVTSRLPASAVFGLLQQPVVARRFGLDAQGLEQARAWLNESGVRWALDADQVGQTGAPAHARHTLADGLERLFLGYALPDDARLVRAGMLPAGGAEGSQACALGALWSYVQALAALRRAASSPRMPPAWVELLSDALADFVAEDDEQVEDLAEVQAAIGALAEQWQRAGGSEPLPVEVVRIALAEVLDDPGGGGVPGGGVTFAAISALRGLPYRVVCAIGLADGAFPSGQRPAEFDLVALHPRPGDRQRRADDRALFLDLLLAARDRLHLSHTGRSVRDNAPLPPSVLVSELLDVLVPALAADPADRDALAKARARLVVEHPLQPFAEEAFRTDADPRRRSFRREYAQALAARAAAAQPPPGTPGPCDLPDEDGDEGVQAPGVVAPFFAAPLAAPGPEWREVPLERLIGFLRNPCRALLRERLGIGLQREDDELEDDEPFVADWGARRALAERLLPALIAGCSADEAFALALAGAEMPAGRIGRHALERELAGLRSFAHRLAGPLRDLRADPHPVAVALDVDGATWRVHGTLAGLHAGGLLRYRWDERRPGDLIEAWLQHLMLCACPAPGTQCVTTWASRDGTWRLSPCAEPLAPLRELLRLHARGLREPLPFFARTAWSYVESGGSVSQARQAWAGGRDPGRSESADAWIRLALRGRADPLGDGLDDFRACAHAVFDPLRAHLEAVAP